MLTKKEIEVLRLRKTHLTQIQVASRLKISQAAVSTFEKKALKKINEAKKTVELARELKMEANLE